MNQSLSVLVEHLTSVLKVKSSIPVGDSDFLCSSTLETCRNVLFFVT